MKFAQRISSIRRGSPRTRAGRARRPRRRCAPPRRRARRSPGGSSRRARAAPSSPGSCASHSISSPGTRRRSSSAIAMSRHAWPRPIGDETYERARGRARPGPRPAGAAARRRDALRELAQQQVDPRRGRARAPRGPRPRGRRARRRSARRRARRARTARSRRACPGPRRPGSARARHSASAASRRATPCSPRVMAEHLRGGVERPRDAVLDLLRRVRLGERLGEEELEEAPVVLLPVVAVVLRPAAIAPRRRPVGAWWRHRRGGRARRTDRTRSGCSRRELRAPSGRRARARRRTTRVDAAVVEDGDGVGDRTRASAYARGVGGRGRTGRCRARRTSRPGVPRQVTGSATSTGGSGRSSTCGSSRTTGSPVP